MKLDGRRESGNVDDRRRMSGGAKAGMGIGGIILIAIITFLSGGNLGDVIQNVGTQMITGGGVEEQTDREFTQEEEELAAFSKKVLASTEDVWTQVFKENGLGEYRAPTMVLYTGAVQTACGQGQRAGGTVLLLCRREVVYRPLVLHLDETPAGCGRRLRLRLCDSA